MRYGRELPGYPFNAKALLTRCLIVSQRKVWGHWLARFSDFGKPALDWNEEQTQAGIADIIHAGKPAMVARFGSGELEATLRGLAIQERREHGLAHAAVRLVAGRSAPFWWDNSIRGGLVWGAGFFPPDDASLDAFAARSLAACSKLDVLAAWQEGETRLRQRFFPNAIFCNMGSFSCPFRQENPWYRALGGMRVLVVHPFAETIRSQYDRREALFPKDRALPEFTLLTYKPAVTLAGNWTASRDKTWFAALDRMTSEIAALDFDVALVGAGAYGMSLAAAVKDMGRIGLHTGGATQLYFGIKGKRWDDSDVGRHFYNDHWVRPLPSEVPGNSNTVEGGCYW